MGLAWLSLGSNLGDRRGHLSDALATLGSHPQCRLLDVSALYETDPVGGVEQDDFLNICAVIRTSLEPLELLALCQSIEAAHLRQRRVHWGPRTLDIDILMMDVDHHSPTLTLPHPHMQDREFVLRPLGDIDPRMTCALAYPSGPSDAVRTIEAKGWYSP
ncbi:2-amino-4-hydroxy-6-hydroxymethyldihydropteridine diphosphokinase [Litorivicinus lipolyticus]|uniref:2-amino-4-hydroxy-6-hydroxymethyldihydropteridine pyrophosphokinase n=1 Tax=Litorivicinus lipolyticus TaxID=418701 RepID=A0A5Q2Q9T9_9GAMM|nr:2-amino-4-hydroxy-6-hydroxymethyldihydropteridine diphosphokinase [Litorivicinus lipolyticus]QGG81068.1 2-amino-4-hydroxy-6-hydroxymethyldihydropteridine diphosphokinase [Litorivicinus lipolyticus]